MITYQMVEDYPGEDTITYPSGVLQINIWSIWGMYTDEANNFLVNNAVNTVKRLMLVRKEWELSEKLDAINTILFIYYSGYHLMHELNYRELGRDDHGGLSDTVVREVTSEFGNYLIRAIAEEHNIDEDYAEHLIDWNAYYDARLGDEEDEEEDE